MISIDDFLYYVDDALDGMARIVSDLGDDLANRRPDLPGANSPFAILTHRLGVMEYWGGEVVAGRSIVRDRPAEFRATGGVAELTDRVERARQQLRADVVALNPFGPPRSSPHDMDATLRWLAPRAAPCCTSTRSSPNIAVSWRSREMSCEPHGHSSAEAAVIGQKTLPFRWALPARAGSALKANLR